MRLAAAVHEDMEQQMSGNHEVAALSLILSEARAHWGMHSNISQTLK